MGQFEELRAALPEVLAGANQAIEDTLRAELTALYGPKLARRWEVLGFTSGADGEGGMLASVRVFTEDPYVYGYEFGTRAHVIVPRTRRALRFDAGGGTVFATIVHHPGTKPHDRREAIEAALAESAEIEWDSAISALLDSASA